MDHFRGVSRAKMRGTLLLRPFQHPHPHPVEFRTILNTAHMLPLSATVQSPYLGVLRQCGLGILFWQDPSHADLSLCLLKGCVMNKWVGGVE